MAISLCFYGDHDGYQVSREIGHGLDSLCQNITSVMYSKSQNIVQSSPFRCELMVMRISIGILEGLQYIWESWEYQCKILAMCVCNNNAVVANLKNHVSRLKEKYAVLNYPSTFDLVPAKMSMIFEWLSCLSPRLYIFHLLYPKYHMVYSTGSTDSTSFVSKSSASTYSNYVVSMVLPLKVID